MNSQLEKLLLEKDFENLTKKERRFVLSFINEVEYEDQRSLLINSRKVFQSKLKCLSEPEISRDGVKRALMAQWRNKKQSSIIFQRPLRHIKSYQYAYMAILIILFIGILVFVSTTSGIGNEPDIATIYLYEGRERQALNASNNPVESIDVTNSYLLNNDSLFKALDKMNDHLIIETQGLDVDIMIPYLE